MSERGMGVKRAIVDAIHRDDPQADMPTNVARAICEHLGIGWDTVRNAARTPLLCSDPQCVHCAPAAALSALLEAAEVGVHTCTPGGTDD